MADDPGGIAGPTDQPRDRWSWQSSLGVAAMFLAGIVYAVLVAVAIAAAAYDRDPSVTSIFVAFTVLVLGPAVALWWTHDRYWYGLAGGAITVWAAIGLFFLLEDDTWYSAEELDRKADRIAASGTPAYYLGDTVRGNDLEDIVRYAEFGGHGVEVGYDYHCRDGCTAEISVSTLSMSREYLQEWDCERLERVLGVPAVSVDNQGLALFTGHSMILIEDYESGDPLDGRLSLEGALSLAPMLRQLGADSPVRSLPAPEPVVLSAVAQACGPMP